MFVTATSSAAETLVLDVDGVEREALVLAPIEKSSGGSPLVFLFHGHGGTAANITKKYDLHSSWPEAIVVAPQGLATPGRYDPEGKKSGWRARRIEGVNRDLRFFDELLANINEKFDVGLVFASGHSNGGAFTYFVAAERQGTFAAIAPSAAASRAAGRLEPIPVIHIAGAEDQLVPIQGQRRVAAALKRINDCELSDDPWGGDCRYCESDKGTPLVMCVHEGGHKFTPERVPAIVEFFQIFEQPVD